MVENAKGDDHGTLDFIPETAPVSPREEERKTTVL